MTTLVNQYDGGYNNEPVSESPGLLNQTMSNGLPSGLTNINVATLLIGGNDYEADIESVLSTVAAATSIPPSDTNIGEFLGKSLYNAFTGLSQGSIPFDIATGVSNALTAITAQKSQFPIVVVSPPNLAYTPLVQSANSIVNGFNLPLIPQNTLLGLFNAAASLTDSLLTNIVGNFAKADPNIRFLNLDSQVLDPILGSPTNIQNLVIGGKNGTIINSTAAGPVYTDFFVGDSFHPGTVAQALLANAIVGQINTIQVPVIQNNKITPLSDAEILAYAQAVQPVTKVTLTGPTASVPLGSPATFMVQIPSFANVPDPDQNAKNFDQYPPTGSVTFIDVAQGNKVLGVASLIPQGSGGTFTGSIATFTTSTLNVGLHQVVAIYNGDTVYPSASTATATVYVGKPMQAQVFSAVTNLQTQLGVQIAEARVNLWNTELSRGARPRRVARAAVMYLYTHTKLPRQQAVRLVDKALHSINSV